MCKWAIDSREKNTGVKLRIDIAVMKEKVNSIVILHVFIYHDLIKGTYMYNDEI
jgi:hypothetical protein